MKKTIIITLLSILFNIQNAASYEDYVDTDLIKKASQPRLVQNGILFTLPQNYGTVIYLRTSIDNWEKSYYFKKSQYEIYYTFVPIDSNIKKVKYLLNVDGFWESDSQNESFEEDYLGTKISIVTVPEGPFYYKEMPEVKKSAQDNIKSVYFRLHDPKAFDVNLVCSVDNWNQYSYKMTKTSDGYWEITKNFARGKYLYYFLVDGKIVLDINNTKKVFHHNLGEISYFIIE